MQIVTAGDGGSASLAVLSVLDLRYEGSGAGVCFVPMTAEGALLFALVPPLALLAIFAACCGPRWNVNQRSRNASSAAAAAPAVARANDGGGDGVVSRVCARFGSPRPAAWALVLLLFSSVTKASLTLLQCARVPLPGQSDTLVLLRAGFVECYKQPYQIALLAFGLPLFAAAPVLLAIVARRIAKMPSESRTHVLTAVYRPQCAWYESALMLRRLLLIVCATFVLNTVSRALALFALLLLASALHVSLQPFRARVANLIESMLLGAQLFLAALNVRMAQRQEDGRLPPDDAATLQGTLLIAAAGVVLLALLATRRLLPCASRWASDDERTASTAATVTVLDVSASADVCDDYDRRTPLLLNEAASDANDAANDASA